MSVYRGLVQLQGQNKEQARRRWGGVKTDSKGPGLGVEEEGYHGQDEEGNWGRGLEVSSHLIQVTKGPSLPRTQLVLAPKALRPRKPRSLRTNLDGGSA